MIQSYINKIVNKKVFKHLPQKIKGKFVNNNRRNNIYTQYLSNSKSSTDINTFLQALCYNTDYDNNQWNQRIRYLYFYNRINGKLTQTLTNALLKKIYNDIKNNDIYMERIYDILADYHILFDDNGNVIPLDKYPLIYYVGAYLETFTTIYLTVNLTKKDIKQLAMMVSGVNILIDQPEHIKLIKLIGKNKNKIDEYEDIIVYKFYKSHSGIVELIITLANSDVNINSELTEKIYNKLNIFTPIIKP